VNRFFFLYKTDLGQFNYIRKTGSLL